MIVKTRAIVLSAIKYAEADLIVSCYTENHGIKSYLLRNILKSKRASLKASYFQPLTQLDIVATHKNKGSLEFIREAKVTVPYKSLHTDVIKTSLVMFLSEILKSCIREEEPNPQLFQFLEDSISWLDENNQVANFHIYFLLQLSSYLGFYPDASEKEQPYFNVLEGIFQQNKIDSYCLEGDTVDCFKQFFDIDFNQIENIKLSKKSRSEVLDLLLTYYQIHVQGYQKPKSLVVLNQLFS